MSNPLGECFGPKPLDPLTEQPLEEAREAEKETKIASLLRDNEVLRIQNLALGQCLERSRTDREAEKDAEIQRGDEAIKILAAAARQKDAKIKRLKDLLRESRGVAKELRYCVPTIEAGIDHHYSAWLTRASSALAGPKPANPAEG